MKKGIKLSKRFGAKPQRLQIANEKSSSDEIKPTSLLRLSDQHVPSERVPPSRPFTRDFVCVICMDLIVNSVTTKCGHSFCEICLSEYLAFFAKCPSCPRRLRHSHHFGACKEMDNLIDKMLHQNQDQELLVHHRKRVEENKNWNRRRMISKFKVGMFLDVQTKEYIWLVGIVKKIVIRSQNFRFLVISYKVRN